VASSSTASCCFHAHGTVGILQILGMPKKAKCILDVVDVARRIMQRMQNILAHKKFKLGTKSF